MHTFLTTLISFLLVFLASASVVENGDCDPASSSCVLTSSAPEQDDGDLGPAPDPWG